MRPGLDTRMGFEREWVVRLKIAKESLANHSNSNNSSSNWNLSNGVGVRVEKGRNVRRFEQSTTRKGEQDWVVIVLEGFSHGTSRETVESLLARFLKFWRGFEVLEEGRKFSFMVHGEKAARSLETTLGGWKLEEGRTVRVVWVGGDGRDQEEGEKESDWKEGRERFRSELEEDQYGAPRSTEPSRVEAEPKGRQERGRGRERSSGRDEGRGRSKSRNRKEPRAKSRNRSYSRGRRSYRRTKERDSSRKRSKRYEEEEDGSERRSRKKDKEKKRDRYHSRSRSRSRSRSPHRRRSHHSHRSRRHNSYSRSRSRSPRRHRRTHKRRHRSLSSSSSSRSPSPKRRSRHSRRSRSRSRSPPRRRRERSFSPRSPRPRRNLESKRIRSPSPEPLLSRIAPQQRSSPAHSLEPPKEPRHHDQTRPRTFETQRNSSNRSSSSQYLSSTSTYGPAIHYGWKENVKDLGMERDS